MKQYSASLEYQTAYILVVPEAPTVLSEAEEEIAVFKVVFVHHVMYVVSGYQQLPHRDCLSSARSRPLSDQTIH